MAYKFNDILSRESNFFMYPIKKKMRPEKIIPAIVLNQNRWSPCCCCIALNLS